MDQSGRLPLHVAIMHRASQEVVEALVDAHTEAIPVMDHGGKIPVDYAIDVFGKDHAVVTLLNNILLILGSKQ